MKKKKTKLVKNVAPDYIDWDYNYDQNSDFVFDKSSKITCVVVLAIYLIALLTASFLPGSNISSDVSYWGTLLHYFGYFFLFSITLLTFFVLGFRCPISKAIGFGTLIAISTEIIQLFIPGRFGTIGDACINLVGLFTIPLVLLYAQEVMDEEKGEY